MAAFLFCTKPFKTGTRTRDSLLGLCLSWYVRGFGFFFRSGLKQNVVSDNHQPTECTYVLCALCCPPFFRLCQKRKFPAIWSLNSAFEFFTSARPTLSFLCMRSSLGERLWAELLGESPRGEGHGAQAVTAPPCLLHCGREVSRQHWPVLWDRSHHPLDQGLLF